MAVRRIFLGAEDHSPPTLRERDELRDSICEIGSRRTARVVDGTVLPIESAIVGTTPELPAQKDVVDAARA